MHDTVKIHNMINTCISFRQPTTVRKNINNKS